MKPITVWQRLGRAVRDRSFIIGSILVVLFLLAAVLGPELAPRNPYTRDRVQTIDGEMQGAPFPPSRYYPLGTDTEGRDLLSLLLHGARQTLVIAFVAMTIRMLLGLVLGTACGWWPGGPFDRAVTAITEFLAAIPTLVLAMLLVSAVGIRRGQISFIIAISAIGWGEVTQIVRGHVMGIRGKLYISAARAVGLSSPEILSRHVLPNLLSTLLGLAALEMAGVLLLLGELGFVGIFIGGGGMYVSDSVQFGQQIHYYDVPDWGAMLGNSWRYFRSQPWLPLAPALSFLVAILGFNLFGYGLQRFVEKGRFHPSGWSMLRLLAIVGVLLFGARTLLASTSIEAQFVAMARQFDVQRAWNDILYLTQPELEGRPTGPGPGYQAAGYIAHQVRQAGLTPLADGTYFQQYTTSPVEVVAPPVLEVLGEDGEPILRLEDEVSLNPAVPFRTHFGERPAYDEEHEAYDEESVTPSYVENQVPGDLEEDEVSFENDTYFGLPARFASDLEEQDVLSGRLIASGLLALFAIDREEQDVLSLGRLVASGRDGVLQAEGERTWLIEAEGTWRTQGEGSWYAEGEGVWHAEGEGGWHAEGEGAWHAEGEGAWHTEGEGVWHADAEGAWHAEGEGVWHAEGEGVWHTEGEGVWYAEGEDVGHADAEGAWHAEGEGSRAAVGAWETVGEGIWQAELVVVGDVTSAPRTGLILLLDPTDAYVASGFVGRNLAVGVIRLASDAEVEAGGLHLARTHSQMPRYPHLLISESGARQLLALAGIDLDQIQADRRAGQSIVLHTGLQVRVTAHLAYNPAPAVNVVGYFPAADMRTQGERILVAASYTGPLAPEGTVYPGADEDASAVAVMLEVARLWHDIGFEPKRTVVFAALDSRGGQYLVNNPIFPINTADTWTMVMIHGIGAGDRRLARLPALGDSLALTFDGSARRMGVHTTELSQWRFPFQSGTISEAWQMEHAYRGLAVTRPGDERSGTPADTPDHLDPQLVAEAGWTLAHYLMMLSSR